MLSVSFVVQSGEYYEEYIMRNKTTEVTEGHSGGVFGIVEYIPEEVSFVQVNYAQLLTTQEGLHKANKTYPATP